MRKGGYNVCGSTTNLMGDKDGEDALLYDPRAMCIDGTGVT